MTNYLSTAEISGIVSEVLPAVVDNKSVLSKVGANHIGYNTTDVLKSVVAGGAAVVAEGENKPFGDVAINNIQVQRAKLATVLTTSEEFEATAEGKRIVAEALRSSLDSLVKSADIFVLNGKSAADGSAVSGVTGVVGGSQIVTAAADDLENGIVDALAANYDANGMILSGEGFGAIAYARTGDSGLQKYPLASKNEVFDVFSVEAAYGKSLGLDGFTATAETKNNNIALIGNFENVYRAFSEPVVRVSREATLSDGTNLFQQNKIAYLVEMFVSFAVVKNDEFTTVQKGE